MSLRDRIAPALQDLVAGPMEKKPFIQEGRRKLLAPAQGRVLEVGAGTGFNARYYPEGVGDVTLTDELGGMLRRAERRADEAGRRVETVTAPVERLPFEDESFDTVVGSLLLCSVDDQDAALAEIRRVLKPGGRYLFLEHVRSDDPKVARRQDRWERVWGIVAMGCHPNRDTLPRIESAFAVDEVERSELPEGPSLIRPYVLGRAHRQ
jgi:ubiquinone/menaquinone biosynthesis C-methylase UbiE